MEKIIANNQITNNQGDFFCTLWFIGWLFTIGYLKLTFWKGVLALIIWPYYLGVKFHQEYNQKQES